MTSVLFPEHQGLGVVRRLGVSLFSKFQLYRFSLLHSLPRYDLAMLAADEVDEKIMLISLCIHMYSICACMYVCMYVRTWLCGGMVWYGMVWYGM